MLNITINDSLSLNVYGCEDLWFNVGFLGFKSKYTFAVIYRHPWNNYSVFLETLDANMQKLNRQGVKALVFGDINIDLNSDKNLFPLTDYTHILRSNAFISLIDKPTRVTRTSQTVIDHILTNDCESILTPGVLTYNIADHYPIFCTISNSNFKSTKNEELHTFRNIASVNRKKFCDDLACALLPLQDKFMFVPTCDLTSSAFNEDFNDLMNAIIAVIDKHAVTI